MEPRSSESQADSSLSEPPGKQYAAAAAAKSLQSCPTLCDAMDCSLPGSSVHGSFQARVLEWAASPSPGKQCTQRRKLMNRNLRARRPAGGALSPGSTAEPKPEEERPAPPSSPAGLSRFVYSFGCPPSFLYLP